MKHFNLKSLVVLFFLLAAGGIYFASVFPASPTVEVTAEVISRTARSSPTGNIGILICELESGNTVMVETPPLTKVRTGDQVMLRSYERYLFSDMYQFGGRLIKSGKPKTDA